MPDPEVSINQSATASGGASREMRLSRAREVRKVTWWGFSVNLFLAGLKAAAGLLFGSQALVADAVHSLSDMVTDVAVLVGSRFWEAPPDADHPHGHGRIETLIAFLIGLVLAGVGTVLGWEAVRTWLAKEPGLASWPVLFVAVLSILSKEWIYRWTVRVALRVQSSSLTANAWHHRTDALSSVPVVLAVVCLYFFPGWPYFDQLATILVSAMILYASWRICFPAVQQLVDSAASEESVVAIRAEALSAKGVKAIHAVRTRWIGSGYQVDLHVMVDPDQSVYDGHEVAGRVKHRLLESDLNVLDVLVHIEPFEGTK